MRRGAVCCGLLFILLSYGYAGQRTETDISGRPFMLYFRFDKAMVDSGYLDNGRTLHHLEEILADCRLCERIDSINILSFASPDGDHSYNERLTHRRSIAVKGYLVWKYPHLDQYRIHSRPRRAPAQPGRSAANTRPSQRYRELQDTIEEVEWGNSL